MIIHNNLKEKLTFTSKFTIHLNILCVLLPNGLSQLNEICLNILKFVLLLIVIDEIIIKQFVSQSISYFNAL